MGQPLKSITIVGGGTAGWLVATFLNRALKSKNPAHKTEITLIKSPNVPIVGVGEGTVPGMVLLMNQLGISERELLERTDAAFKVCARFLNWNHDSKGGPIEFLNILNSPQPIDGRLLGEYFVTMHPSRDMDTAGLEYAKACSPVVEILRGNLGPRRIGADEFSGELGYTYHFDATKLAAMLQEIATKRGVIHILDDVDRVEQDERGFISKLHLRERGEHKVEFVIDCTGFRGVIAQQTLGEKFLPYDKHLLVDRAAVMQVPPENPKEIEIATRATGLSAGWNFRIPLFSRIGTGYVFSSKFISDDEACDELVKLYGKQAEGVTPRIIRMRTGRIANAWTKNCVALGLSSGFIEPLEATAIFMTDLAMRWLYHYLPTNDFEPELARGFNARITQLYDEVRDFIQLHYHLNNRTDTPFWVAAREGMELSDRLKDNLEMWRHTVPQDLDLPSTYLFGANVYALVLIAKGFYRGRQIATAPFLDPEIWKRYQRAVWEAKRKHLEGLPSHYDLIESIRAGKGNAEPARARGRAQFNAPSSAVRLPKAELPGVTFKR